MKGAPPTLNETLNAIDLIVRSVDQRGRQADDRWGIGRLPMLVPIDVAERFRSQQRKFSAAVWDRDTDAVRKHGEAMLRGYGKLEELATEGGATPTPPEQWEFETGDGLIILVKDLRDTGRVETHGRQAQVWSLDEIVSVIRAHPLIATAKDVFPGAVVETVRPSADVRQDLNDSLMELPL